jgi:hypothetical protein
MMVSVGSLWISLVVGALVRTQEFEAALAHRCLGLIGVTIVVIAVNIERIEIAPILTYVIGLVTMLALSAAYNICLARQVGSAPLRPLRDAGLGSRALAYLQLVSGTCR